MNIAIVNHWPTELTAEYEFIKRFKSVSQKRGIKITMIGPTGIILDGMEKGSRVEIIKPDFILAFDPNLTEPFCDIPIYTPLWIPDDFLSVDSYLPYIKSINKVDKFIGGYSSDILIEHVKNYLAYHGRTLNELYPFYASPSIDSVLPPTIDAKSHLAYVGVNCEKIETTNNNHAKARYHDIFKALDKLKCVEFYGPKKFGGMRPWSGFKSYHGQIPFDGTSLIATFNKAGIALVFSSIIHNKCGVPTSRLFEAIAAGCIIIADKNPFICKTLGDSVLYVDIYQEPDIVISQIKAHIDWIHNNSDRARKMVEMTQEIFTQKFCLEHSLDNLITLHEKKIFPSETKQLTIDVIIPLLFPSKENVLTISKNINSQTHKNIHVIYISNSSINLDSFKQSIPLNIDLTIAIDKDAVTTGTLVELALQSLTSEYFVLMEGNQTWHSKHLESLLCCLMANKSALAACSESYAVNTTSGEVVLSQALQLKYIHLLSLQTIVSSSSIYHDFFYMFERVVLKSCVLFRRKIIEGLSTIALKNINGCEHLYFILRAVNQSIADSALAQTSIKSVRLKSKTDEISLDVLYPYRCKKIGNKAFNTSLKMLVDAQILDHYSRVCSYSNLEKSYDLWSRVITLETLQKKNCYISLKKKARRLFQKAFSALYSFKIFRIFHVG